MSSDRTLLAVSGYLSAQAISPKRPHERRRTHRRFVTISREAGAGGTSVGRRIVDRLNDGEDDVPWTLFDHALVDAMLEKYDLPREMSRYLPEEGVRWFQETLNAMVGQHPSSIALVNRLNETILALGGMGNTVLLGRGANLLTRSIRGGFHVRLVADPESRLERLKEARKLDDRAAEELLRKLDKDRAEYVRGNFGADVADVLAYDCVINTTWMSYDAAAELIAARVRHTVNNSRER